MNFLNDLIPEEYVQAFGWTLLHSIWQSALIALLVGILMVVLQRSSVVRYLVAAGSMPLILIAALFTFYLSLESAVIKSSENLQRQEIRKEKAFPETEPLETKALSEIQNTEEKSSLIDQFKSYFSSHFPLIITLWFIGIIVLTLRFLGGMAYAQRLKRYKVVDITPLWQEKLTSISQKIGLHQKVRLLESSMVAVPMVIGYLKPVILIPIGAISGLSASQVESILAHELAHILRRDYLVNIIQTVIEILFFYHPAVWWISARVREERENCCDDIAVQVNENILVYAKALTTLGELQVNTPAFAMAATGNNGILFKRIKRILMKPTQNPTFSEGFITACALFICLFAFTLVAKASMGSTITESQKSVEHTEIATISEGDYHATVLTTTNESGDDNNFIIIKDKDGKIVELYLNGKKIPEDEIENYTVMIENSLERKKVKDANSDKITAQDETAIKNMIKELEKEDFRFDFHFNEDETEQNHQDAPKRKEEAESTKEPYKLNSFIQKTMDMAKLGMEMGSLSMEMESLQRKMENSGESNKKTEAEIKKIEQKIKDLEAKMEELGKEIEASGEDFGKMSLDMARSALDSINFIFDEDEDEDPIEEENID